VFCGPSNSLRLVCFRLTVFGLFLMVLWCWPIDARAEEQPGPVEHSALRLKAVEQTVEKRLLSEDLRLRFYGFLEGSYTQNFNNPSSRINQLRIFDVNANQVRPNLAQAVLEREAKADGSRWDRLGFRVKFNVGRDSDFIGGFNMSQWADFQEFYVKYLAPIRRGLNIQAGQINSVVGYEVVESPHNPNYSRSWLFGLGQPFTTRGLRVSYDFDERVSWVIGVISYINSARGDTQNDPLVESAVTVNVSEQVRATLYGLAGNRSGPTGTPGGDQLLIGGYFSWQMTEQTSAVLEAYYSNQANSSRISQAGNARWNGIAGYLIYDVTKQWGVRLRGELYEDAGGYTTCQGTTSYSPRANVCFGATSEAQALPIAQTLWEVTGTVQFTPFPSLITRLEYRYDKSNQKVFQLGDRPTSYQPTLSLDVIYLF
jgi:hypothetical protein